MRKHLAYKAQGFGAKQQESAEDVKVQPAKAEVPCPAEVEAARLLQRYPQFFSSSPELCVLVWPDSARLTYDHAAGALSATGIKTALVQAADKCTVDCPLTEFTGDVQIRGNLTVDGEALVKSLMSYMAGLSGQNGEGGQTVIEGDIQHRGTLSNTGRIESNGVGVDDHEHPGDSGGTTGKPNR